jgi:hypothetical protein
VESLAQRLEEHALAAAAPRLLVLRGAAVCAPDGRVVALVGGDADIRTAAVTELARRGFGYVAGGLLATDESFDVTPAPDPLRFPPPDPSAPDSYATLAGPDAHGLRPAPAGPLRLAAGVELHHDESRRDSPQLRRVRRPGDVSRLEASVVSAPRSWSTTAVPDLIDEVGGLWELRYADVQGIAPVLAELLLRGRRQATGPGQLYVAVGIGDSEERPTPVSGHLLALDGLRRVVWQACAGGASMEDLHAAANRELAGQHAISAQLVAAAVRDLMALDLVVPEEGVSRSGQPELV